MKKTITCRPCKEQNNWEIQDQYGKVLDEHYATKEECLTAGRNLAKACNCEMTVCDCNTGK